MFYLCKLIHWCITLLLPDDLWDGTGWWYLESHPLCGRHPQPHTSPRDFFYILLCFYKFFTFMSETASMLSQVLSVGSGVSTQGFSKTLKVYFAWKYVFIDKCWCNDTSSYLACIAIQADFSPALITLNFSLF